MEFNEKYAMYVCFRLPYLLILCPYHALRQVPFSVFTYYQPEQASSVHHMM